MNLPLEARRFTLSPTVGEEAVPTRAIWVFSWEPTERPGFADDDRHTEGLNICGSPDEGPEGSNPAPSSGEISNESEPRIMRPYFSGSVGVAQ